MKQKDVKIYVTEHVLEVRHGAVGKFLDIRGKIADYFKNEKIFPHWKIYENVISFFDSDKGIKDIGAVIGFNRIAYISHNPPTSNYFSDQAISFLKNLKKAKFYTMPNIYRFGTRIKCFIPSNLEFSEIHKRISSKYFNIESMKLIGGKQNDLQIILELQENKYTFKVSLGPMQKNEAKKYFKFNADEFSKAGVFLDIDCYIENSLTQDEIPDLFKKAMNLVWNKADRIAETIDV